MLENITRPQIKSWLESPCTQLLLAWARYERERLKEFSATADLTDPKKLQEVTRFQGEARRLKEISSEAELIDALWKQVEEIKKNGTQ